MKTTLLLICIFCLSSCLSSAMGQQYQFNLPAECAPLAWEDGGEAQQTALATCFVTNNLVTLAQSNDTCVFLEDITPCYAKACCEAFKVQWNEATNTYHDQLHGLCTRDISINCDKYQTAQTSPPPPPPSSTPSPPTASVPSPPPNTQQTSSASLRGTNCIATFITLIFVIASMILK